ncbi:MAG: hypothetical protein ACTHU1_07490, partial [Arachnia sp.]
MTTTATSRRPESNRRRARVEHYWWISEGEAARSLGIVEVPAICRRAWVTLNDTGLAVTVTRTDSGALTDDGAVDACKVCERMV